MNGWRLLHLIALVDRRPDPPAAHCGRILAIRLFRRSPESAAEKSRDDILSHYTIPFSAFCEEDAGVQPLEIRAIRSLFDLGPVWGRFLSTTSVSTWAPRRRRLRAGRLAIPERQSKSDDHDSEQRRDHEIPRRRRRRYRQEVVDHFSVRVCRRLSPRNISGVERFYTGPARRVPPRTKVSVRVPASRTA